MFKRRVLMASALTLPCSNFVNSTATAQGLRRFISSERFFIFLGAIDSALSLVDRLLSALIQRSDQQLCLLPGSDFRALQFKIQMLMAGLGGEAQVRSQPGGAIEAIEQFFSFRELHNWLILRRMLAVVVVQSVAVMQDLLRLGPVFRSIDDDVQNQLPRLASAIQQLNVLLDEILLDAEFPDSNNDFRFLQSVAQRLRAVRDRAVASDLSLMRLLERRQSVICG